MIVCLGEFILDMFPAETGRDFNAVTAFIPVPGGAPANVAVAARRLGCPSAFMGKVGADPFGLRLTQVLSEHGVETRGMRLDAAARTTLNFLALPDVNTAQCLFYRNPGADMMLRPDELDRGLLEEAAFFHFGSVSLTEEPCRSATLEAARMARSAGAVISFDVNYRPTLWPGEREARAIIETALLLADIVKVNEAELTLLSGSTDPALGCRDIISRGPVLCAVTMGPEGSVFASPSAQGSAPGFPVHAVDATGCGDAFMGALLVRLEDAVGKSADRRRGLEALGSGTLAAAVRYANAAGALTATRTGVIPALPDREEVAAFLASSGGA